jgi:hypothetical protein
MRYLIITNNDPPFVTNWFNKENHWQNNVGMVVCDLQEMIYTTTGDVWDKIEIDNL